MPRVAAKPLRSSGNKKVNWGNAATFQTALAALLLLAGVVNDLRERKVRNPIVLAGFAVGVITALTTAGLQGLMIASLSLLTAIVAILPMYLMRVIGGGDVKLFAAVSLFLNWKAVLITLFASLIWGSVLGVAQVIMQGKGKAFAHNMMAVALRTKLQDTQVHKIPYTVALFFGFLSSLVWQGVL